MCADTTPTKPAQAQCRAQSPSTPIQSTVGSDVAEQQRCNEKAVAGSSHLTYDASHTWLVRGFVVATKFEGFSENVSSSFQILRKKGFTFQINNIPDRQYKQRSEELIEEKITNLFMVKRNKEIEDDVSERDILIL